MANMPSFKVIGIFEFVSSRSKKSWIKLYTTFSMDGVSGVACKELFLSPEVVQGKLELGKTVIPYFRENSNFIQALQVL